MSTGELHLIALAVSGFVLLFVWSLSRIAAQADARAARFANRGVATVYAGKRPNSFRFYSKIQPQHISTRKGEGDRAAAVSADRPSLKDYAAGMMPGAAELYLDKKPRQKVAKRSFAHDGKCCMVRREVAL